MSKEIKPGQNRFISVTCCAECPLNGTCSAWSKLDSKTKTFLNLSNAVPVDMMLVECPLEQMPEVSTELEQLRKELEEVKDDCKFLAWVSEQHHLGEDAIDRMTELLAKLNQQGE